MIGRFQSDEGHGVEEPRGFDDFDMRLGDVMRGERATLGKSLLDVQRELKIKATYIAAIENAEPDVFDTPGFIAGYVRSYARYLDLDPEWAWRAFCVESGFETAHGMSQAASSRRGELQAEAPVRDVFAENTMGFVPRRESMLSRIEPGAVGSLVVLLALIGAVGYGGYAVLTEIQKVQMVPVDQTPEVIADIDPLTSVRPIGGDDDAADIAAVPAPEAFDRLYRPEALDVPVLVARDGPISTLDPWEVGTLVPRMEGPSEAEMRTAAAVGPDRETSGSEGGVAASTTEPGETAPVQVVADTAPEVAVLAIGQSWVRVRSADGTTIYEQIMEEGDRFVLPQTEEPATLRTGQSGAIYLTVGGTPYGPAGAPGQVTGNLPLDAESLTETYDVADLEADAELARLVAELADRPSVPPGQSAPEGE